MAQMTRMRMGEVGMRLADSALSHASGHIPVGMLALCPFDETSAMSKAAPSANTAEHAGPGA